MDDNIICITKLNGAKANHLTSVFRNLENVLTDRNKYYYDKVQALMTVWQQLANFVSETSKESPQSYFDTLFQNTLRFVLRADWPKSINPATKTHLTFTLQRLIRSLTTSGSYHGMLENCKILESVVKDPWGQSALRKILESQNVDLSECRKYFELENPKVVLVRLEMLLLSKCEDIAINLCKACLDTYSNSEETLDFNQDEIDYITDIYYCSLLKHKRKLDLIAEIKKYPLDEGLGLLQRYRAKTVGGKLKEDCKTARVWKYGEKLIETLSNTLLANAVMREELLESQSQLEALIVEWAAPMTVDGELSADALKGIRKFVLIAPSSTRIYPFCSFLIRTGNCKEEHFTMVAKCLIRAINQNMNEVEQYRASRENDKLKETYVQLSKGFLLLSDLLQECVNIQKECLLTAFSLSPSRECLRTIEDFVTKLINTPDPPQKYESQESQRDVPEELTNLSSVELETPPTSVEVEASTETTPQRLETSNNTASEITPVSKPQPVNTSDSLKEILESMGVPENDDNQIRDELDSKLVNKQIDCERSSASGYIVELENLKSFDEAMAGDLNTIVSYRRYHTLTWDLDWPKLKENCNQYLKDFENIDFDDMELKYLDLDYDQFKDQPINNEDLYGIEKGYEHYAFSPSESEEELSSTKRSGVSSFESDEDVVQSGKKRKRAISSDSDEPRNKKKRIQKGKLKNGEAKRRDSQNDLDDEHGFKSENSKKKSKKKLKNKKPIRITSLKYTVSDDNLDAPITQEQEELNNFLADSFKSLEIIEMPPLPSRFNIYEVMLEDTLVPSDSEFRLPRVEDLKFNNENSFTQSIPAVEPIKTEENPRESVVKMKTPKPRKKPPKAPKPKNSMPLQSNESYLNYSSDPATPYPTLLSNDTLFKKKYGSKQPPCENLIENENANAIVGNQKNLVVQLPKLSDTFSFTNKKAFAKKPKDQNTSFSSFVKTNFTEKPAIPSPSYPSTNENTMFSTFPQTSVNVADDTNFGDSIEDIANFLKSYDVSTNCTPILVNDTSQCYQPQITVGNTCGTSQYYQPQTTVENTCDTSQCYQPQTTVENTCDTSQCYQPQTTVENTCDTSQCYQPQTKVENTCQTDISAPDVELWQTFEHLFTPPNYNAFSYDPPKSSIQNNIIPTTSQPVSVPASMVSEPTVSEPTYTCITNGNNNLTIKRTSTEKVDKILHDYQTAIAENPALKNVPAPRKRANSSNAPKKSRSRKNDSNAVKIVKYSKLNGLLNVGETNPSELTPSPVSQQMLPPIDASSQVIAFTDTIQPQYHYNVPIVKDSKPVPGKYLDSVRVKISPHNPNINGTVTSKTSLMRGASTSLNRIPVPVIHPISYPAELTNGHQISLPTTQINNHYQHISPSNTQMNNHISQMQHNDVSMNMNITASNSTYNSFDSPQQQKTTYLRGYEGLTNNFEVRIPRIDVKFDNVSFSNTMTNSKRNSNSHMIIPPVSSNYLPSVRLPKLTSTTLQMITNNSTISMHSNYQMNNFNDTTVASLPATSTQNVRMKTNSNAPMNNVINNISNHLLPDVVLSNTQNIKHESNSIYATCSPNFADGPCHSIPTCNDPTLDFQNYQKEMQLSGGYIIDT